MDMRDVIKERSELAHSYACDGAYFRAAQILTELAGAVQQHADRNRAIMDELVQGSRVIAIPNSDGPIMVTVKHRPGD